MVKPASCFVGFFQNVVLKKQDSTFEKRCIKMKHHLSNISNPRHGPNIKITPNTTQKPIVGAVQIRFPSCSFGKSSTVAPDRLIMIHMDIEPKIGVVFPPKWMVKFMEHPINMDDLGVLPLFLETPIS